MECAGIAALRLMIPIQSGVLLGVRIAEKICAPVKIAVFFNQERGAAAVKQARNRSLTKNAPIFATGFLWTQNTALRAKDKKRAKQILLILRVQHSIIYSNNHGQQTYFIY